MTTIKNGRRILLIVGMHRSGTSLCGHLINTLGYDVTDKTGPAFDNPKGHWERSDAVAFHDRILAAMRRHWASPAHTAPLPPAWWGRPDIRAIRNEMISWLARLIETSPHFAIKDPRLSLLLPVWREICAELAIEADHIFCVRHPAQVVRSLVHRDKMAVVEAEFRWFIYNIRAVQGLGDAPVCVVPYEDWFAADSRNLGRITAYLNSPWRADDPMLRDAVGSIIDRDLRHDDGSVYPSAPLARLHGLLEEAAEPGRFSRELLAYAAAFSDFERLFPADAAAQTGPRAAAAKGAP